MSKHVRERAEKKLIDKKIPFKYICDSLNDNKILINDDLYYYGVILNRFLERSFSSYCKSYCNLRDTCDHKSCYLKNTLFMKLNTMSIEDGYKLLKKFYPHKIIDNISLSQDFFYEESILFIYAEFSIDYFYNFISYHLQNNYYFIKENKTYLPTGISAVSEMIRESSIEDYKKNIRQNIENKAFDIEKLYELDYLITDNLETEEGFISDLLDIEHDLMNKDDFEREQKRNRYIINLRKIN
ncbi:ABC-three component system protein [Enterococcus villorum]|uniref:ABC-three component system protein n=1 Tax=Enterococcus villorum TaxID=112904 RepID=UPI0030B84C1A